MPFQIPCSFFHHRFKILLCRNISYRKAQDSGARLISDVSPPGFSFLRAQNRKRARPDR